MTIPTYDAFMLPVLIRCAEQPWVMRDLIARVADDLDLDEDERDQEIPSGGTTVVASRIHWAKTYLKQAGIVEQPKRGIVQISDRGRVFLSTNPKKIDIEALLQFPEFVDFLNRTKSATDQRQQIRSSSDRQHTSTAIEPLLPQSNTPEEQIDAASSTLLEALRDALLARILEASPTFFERLIIDLLRSMGYGGSLSDAAEQLGGSGDGGVDGVIREDQLGLDRIYLQAKRYQPGNAVGGEAVRAFVGALVQRGAQKGVFITTSSFTNQAKGIPQQAGNLRLVLIDGEELTRLMVKFNVGVRVARSVEIKRIDLDYFEDIDPE